jgi:hypothetical protein
MAYSQRTFDAADDTAGHATYNTAHDPADRPKDTMAHVAPSVRSFACALSDALCRRCDGHSKKSEDAGSHHKVHFHWAGLLEFRDMLLDASSDLQAWAPINDAASTMPHLWMPSSG